MRTTDTRVQPTQQHIVQYVSRETLPDQPWALVRCDEATYLFIREDCVTPGVLQECWSACRWMALNRPHSQPTVPTVVPAQRCVEDTLSIREAVIRGHNAAG